MHSSSHSRRAFLGTSTLAALGLATSGGKRAFAQTTRALKALEPIDGAVVHRRLGRPVDGGLEIDVAGVAPSGIPVTIDGRPAARDGEKFSGTALLRQRENEIRLQAGSGSQTQQATIRIVWDQHSRKRYRVVIDDNSFFLRDITQKGYRSLFDCFYLEMLRDLHRKYGTRFTLNIYFTTGEDWNLRQFPGKYRGEWKDNADWLRLAFHAYANDPPRPYQDAPVEKLLADLDLVAGEIKRFAGDETYSPPVVIHFGMTRPEAWKPLYERGARVLGGYFRKSGGKWDINYRVDDFRSEWLWRHDLLKDYASGIVFSKVDIVVNGVPLEKIVPSLQPAIDDPRQGEVIDILTHEQYFWPFYRNYLPDHAQRMDRALELVTRHGCAPVYLQDGFLGGPA